MASKEVIEIKAKLLPTADLSIYELLTFHYKNGNRDISGSVVVKKARGHVSIWNLGWRELCRSPKATREQIIRLYVAVEYRT